MAVKIVNHYGGEELKEITTQCLLAERPGLQGFGCVDLLDANTSYWHEFRREHTVQ